MPAASISSAGVPEPGMLRTASDLRGDGLAHQRKRTTTDNQDARGNTARAFGVRGQDAAESGIPALHMPRNQWVDFVSLVEYI
jgi:hypothetical protein